eukprot:6191355-Pleurochrysis_carterae.AAC.2
MLLLSLCDRVHARSLNRVGLGSALLLTALAFFIASRLTIGSRCWYALTSSKKRFQDEQEALQLEPAACTSGQPQASAAAAAAEPAAQDVVMASCDTRVATHDGDELTPWIMTTLRNATGKKYQGAVAIAGGTYAKRSLALIRQEQAFGASKYKENAFRVGVITLLRSAIRGRAWRLAHQPARSVQIESNPAVRCV